MPNVSLPCPICRNTVDCHDRDDLIINTTVIHDSDGEPPYTMPTTFLDGYEIDWRAPGHTECENIYNWLTSFSSVPTRDMGMSEEASQRSVRAFLDTFDDAIAKAAFEADAEGSDD